MKYSRQWLTHEFCPNSSFLKCVEMLRSAGLAVNLLPTAPVDFSGIIVGEIKAISPHPNADKLQICKVYVGKDDFLSIVCGAKNIYEGMRVPVAVIGAILPGNFTIKKAKLRGEESSGMLCSAKELGFANNAQGIFPLPLNAPIGADLIDYLNLHDEMVELLDLAKEMDELDVLSLSKLFPASDRKCHKALKINKLKNLLKVVFRL